MKPEKRGYCCLVFVQIWLMSHMKVRNILWMCHLYQKGWTACECSCQHVVASGAWLIICTPLLTVESAVNEHPQRQNAVTCHVQSSYYKPHKTNCTCKHFTHICWMDLCSGTDSDEYWNQTKTKQMNDSLLAVR